MPLYRIVWHCIELYGVLCIAGYLMVLFGIVLYGIVVHGIEWYCMDLPASPQCPPSFTAADCSAMIHKCAAENELESTLG